MRLLLIVLLLIVFSCADQRQKSALDTASEMEMVSADYSPLHINQPEPQHAIIKTANYKFQVAHVESSTKNIEAIVKQYGGTVADMNLVSVSTEISNTFTIRVPAQNFEPLMDALGADATFTNYKRISTEDVSEEFVDIESRLKTKKEVRDRYIDILKDKAKTVKDVLAAEEQIRILQEEIEAKEGRLQYLKNRVAFSTVHLEIYQHVLYQETPDTFEKPFRVKITEGFANGWSIVTTFALFLVNIWPLVVIALVVFISRHWLRNKILRKTEA